jgi:hypothetical protein
LGPIKFSTDPDLLVVPAMEDDVGEILSVEEPAEVVGEAAVPLRKLGRSKPFWFAAKLGFHLLANPSSSLTLDFCLQKVKNLVT